MATRRAAVRSKGAIATTDASVRANVGSAL